MPRRGSPSRRPRAIARSQHDRLPQVLAADVDERRVAADRERRDRRALDQPVGLALGELAVVAGPRLGLVEVDRDVRGLAGVAAARRPTSSRWGTPRRRGRGGRTSFTVSIRSARRHAERRAQPLVAARCDVAVERDGLGSSQLRVRRGSNVQGSCRYLGLATAARGPASTRRGRAEARERAAARRLGHLAGAERRDQLAHPLGAHRRRGSRSRSATAGADVAHAEAFLLVQREQPVVGDLLPVRDAGRSCAAS